MSLALTRESYFWHKVHSLTGIIPVGFYMVQHLTLNSFSLGGAKAFNDVIYFFEAMPKHILLGLEIFAIWIPLAFHAIYGLFITGRARQNFIGTKYGWSQNRMYVLQRATGIFLFFMLIYHILDTTGKKYVTGDPNTIKFAAWHDKLTANFGIMGILYMIFIVAASYHLAYGIWNFCIRWGITISDRAQVRVQKFSLAFFFIITGLGWASLAGFVFNDPNPTKPAAETIQTQYNTRLTNPSS